MKSRWDEGGDGGAFPGEVVKTPGLCFAKAEHAAASQNTVTVLMGFVSLWRPLLRRHQ